MQTGEWKSERINEQQLQIFSWNENSWTTENEMKRAYTHDTHSSINNFLYSFFDKDILQSLLLRIPST